MLNFFRKHQKIFFIIVTTFVVISFCFFGTFSTYSGNDTPDREIAKAVDGSSITLRETEAVGRLLATSFEERTVAPNLFNDGVIRKEFLSTGMAALLVERYIDQIKGDLEPRLKKAKHFKPYVHPRAPFISAELTWQQYFPALSRDLAMLKGYTEGDASADEFNLLTRLYVSQLQLPPDTLKQLLTYQQTHFQNLSPDPRLQQADLSLFGFHTMEDWFGPHFLQIAGRFILNAAAAAVQKGYEVTYDEARADLFQNVQVALKNYQLNTDEAPAYYQEQLRVLQLDEVTAVKAWRKVMLFRRLFHDVGNAVVVDPLIYESFGKFAKEGVAVDLYELPEELRFRDINSVAKFQVYLDAVASSKHTGSTLPSEYKSPEAVEECCPELVERSFTVEYAEINKEQLASQISLKETWEWELEEKNWRLLSGEFELVAECTAEDKEERFLYLDALEPKERLKIDTYARMKIVDSRGDWIEDALQNAPVHTKTLSIRSKGGNLPILGISDQKAFGDLLQLASLTDATPASLGAIEKLKNFSGDDKHYYRLKVLGTSGRKEILSFAVATRDGTLQALVDARLEAAYPDQRRRDPSAFQKSDGSMKSLPEAREELLKRVYSDVAGVADNSPELRLSAYVKAAKSALEQNGDAAHFVKSSAEQESTLANQWLLHKSSRVVTRSSQDGYDKEGVIHLPVGSWSDVQTPGNGALVFFHVQEKVAGNRNDDAAEGQGILSIGARRFLTTQLLNEMGNNGF